MWDHRTYEDTDYGLDEGETFEPDLDDDESFDLSLPHIMTILGPIEPEEFGVCLPAARLLPASGADVAARVRSRRLEEAAEELEAFASVGGRSVVDPATAATGRDLAGLQYLTQRVPSHLVAATGAGADGIVRPSEIDREIRDGIGERGVWPGAISLHANELLDLIRPGASRDAVNWHGLPLMVELDAWDDATAMEIASSMAAGTMHAEAPGSLVLHGPSGVPDPALMRVLAEQGGFAIVTAPGEGHQVRERDVASQVVAFIRDGLADQLLVTLSLGTPRLPVALPMAPRTPYLIDWFPLALMDAGASALDARRILIENPARAFTITPRSVGSA